MVFLVEHLWGTSEASTARQWHHRRQVCGSHCVWPSHRRYFHFTDTPTPSLLKHLLKGERRVFGGGEQQNSRMTVSPMASLASAPPTDSTSADARQRRHEHAAGRQQGSSTGSCACALCSCSSSCDSPGWSDCRRTRIASLPGVPEWSARELRAHASGGVRSRWMEERRGGQVQQQQAEGDAARDISYLADRNASQDVPRRWERRSAPSCSPGRGDAGGGCNAAVLVLDLSSASASSRTRPASVPSLGRSHFCGTLFAEQYAQPSSPDSSPAAAAAAAAGLCILAVCETVILLHPRSTFGGCFNRDRQGVPSK